MRRLILACAAAGVLAQGASLAASPTTFKVTSTLDGMHVLPRRVVWTVSITPTPPKQSWVSFLIDGKSLDQNYIHSSVTFPDKGGYLVTSWLSPGMHTFTARVHPAGGKPIDDTVRATVAKPVTVPAALAGTWEKSVPDTSNAPKGSPTPAGTYKLTFDPRWIQGRYPGKFVPHASDKTGNGWIIDNDWTPGAKTFDAYGGVYWKRFGEKDAEGGSWCNWDGPKVTYTWSVSGNTLTLTPVGGTDPCSFRNFIWPGTWTRVG